MIIMTKALWLFSEGEGEGVEEELDEVSRNIRNLVIEDEEVAPEIRDNEEDNTEEEEEEPPGKWNDRSVYFLEKLFPPDVRYVYSFFCVSFVKLVKINQFMVKKYRKVWINLFFDFQLFIFPPGHVHCTLYVYTYRVYFL